MSQQVEIKLPRGRLVSGHPMKLRPSTDPQTRQQKIGKKDGQPLQECFIQIAVPKTDPGLATVFSQMATAAGRAFPENPAQDQFAWKIDDGDAQVLDRQTGQYKARPDYCWGHWLFNVKSYNFVPTCVYQPAPGQPHQEIVDPAMIKTGDYVDAVIKVEPNGAFGPQAGIYMNPGLIRFNEAGGAISTGGGMSAADADQYFSGSTAHAPQQPAAQPPMGQPQQPMQPAAQPPMQQPQQPGSVPAPNYDPNFAHGPTGNGS